MPPGGPAESASSSGGGAGAGAGFSPPEIGPGLHCCTFTLQVWKELIVDSQTESFPKPLD